MNKKILIIIGLCSLVLFNGCIGTSFDNYTDRINKIDNICKSIIPEYIHNSQYKSLIRDISVNDGCWVEYSGSLITKKNIKCDYNYVMKRCIEFKNNIKDSNRYQN